MHLVMAGLLPLCGSRCNVSQADTFHRFWWHAGLLLLALEDVQSLLAAPDLSAELLFVLALVLSLCSARWPGDDGVVRASSMAS